MEQNNNTSKVEDLDDSNEPQILDEEAHSPQLIVPQNSPSSSLNENSYMFKKEQIMRVMQMLRETPSNNKTRREIRSLERHLENVIESERKFICYDIFKDNMKTAAKNDKNMGTTLKNLYQ